VNIRSQILVIGILALTLIGIVFSFTPIFKGPTQTREVVTHTLIETSTLTSLKSVSYETYAPRTSISNLVGERPADIKRIAFSQAQDALFIELEVNFIEGFARPYSYGVFLSNSTYKGGYCVLFLPWPQDNPKVTLIDLKDYSQEDYSVEIEEVTVKARIPLKSLEGISTDEPDFTFIVWASSWAHDFVPINRIEDRENIWFFDDLPPSQISFSPIKHRIVSIQTSTAIKESTQLKIATRVASKEPVFWWSDILAPSIPWALAAILLIILWNRK